jgi:type 1 glutamine amidotransferase
MKAMLALALAVCLCAAALVAPAQAKMASQKPLRVLVVTGGHDFEREAFTAMWNGLDGVEWTEAKHPDAHKLLTPEAGKAYDVVALYDMWSPITPEARAAFAELVRKGKGVVAMHHCLAGYPDWLEYDKIIGGRYFERVPAGAPPSLKASTFADAVPYRVHVADRKHPIVRGIVDFDITDEVYGSFRVEPDSRPLLAATEPRSGPVIGWTRTYGKARTCYLMLGHDHVAYGDPNFRKLLVQALFWAARR